MNIKDKIGNRIRNERTAKGLTRKELAALTEDMNVSRINNYERGDRTPGPDDIKQLAKALEVSPAYLMGFSDDREGQLTKTPGTGTLIPIFSTKQALSAEKHFQEIISESHSEQFDFLPVKPEQAQMLGENAYAYLMTDDSMSPEIKAQDILVIDPAMTPKPGDFVAVQLQTADELMIRKYKQLSVVDQFQQYELIALHEDWANLQVCGVDEVRILGTVCFLNRVLKNTFFQ